MIDEWIGRRPVRLQLVEGAVLAGAHESGVPADVARRDSVDRYLPPVHGGAVKGR